MRRIKLIIQYDGTAYYGWQSQPRKDQQTVQGELEQALFLIFKEPIKLTASGRTDRGVHAEGQVATFDIQSKIPTDSIGPALNGIVPDDIVIIQAAEVDLEFHPRISAQSKWYRYTIFNNPLPNVFRRKYSFHVSYQLNWQDMQEACQYFEGTYDFRSFSSAKTGVRNFVRTIEKCTIEEDGEIFHIDIVASGFLYNMMRIIVGTLLEVGRGRIKPADIGKIIASQNRSEAGPTAPPQGLCLKKVNYFN